MAKIIVEREKCIGCGSCMAICPRYFLISEDGKSSIIGGQRDEKINNDELEAGEVDCAQGAADGCPVQCIHIN